MKPIFAALFLFSLSPVAHAQNTPPIPRAQTQAFALAYTLRMCDLRAQGFVGSVKALKDVDDDQAAGAEVRHLSKEAANLRRRQAAAYTQIAGLLDQMDAPAPLRQWAAQTSKSLAAPLVYSDEAQSLMKTEPDTAATLAELSEVQTVTAQEDSHQASLSLWLKLTGGRLSVWTAEVGTLAADLSAAKQSAANVPLGLARRMLQTAPLETPSDARGELSELLPRGGGNLQALASVSSAGLPPEKMALVSQKLRKTYNAYQLTELPDKAE